MARIVIGSSIPLVEYALSRYLSGHKLVTAVTGEMVIHRAIEHNADIILLDRQVRVPTLPDTLRLLREFFPYARVILYTDKMEPRYEMGAIARGVSGFVTWQMPMSYLGKAVKTVFHGNYFFDGRAMDYYAATDYIRDVTGDTIATIENMRSRQDKYRLPNADRQNRKIMRKVASRSGVTVDLKKSIVQKKQMVAEDRDRKRPFAARLRKDFYGR